jgi:hypothetical protein
MIFVSSGEAQSSGSGNQPDSPDRGALPKGDIIYLKDQNGRPVPVPINASVQEYLKWLEAREAEAATKIPDYDLVSLSLSGTSKDQTVDLNAVVSLRIREEESPVRVPLQFNEAVLKKVSHTGTGEFAFIGLDNKSGYVWSLSGAGLHEIQLSLSVPVTQQLPAKRFQLTLPQAPVSSLELTVDVPNASFKLPQRSAFEITPTGQQTFLTLFGLPTDLDLVWQSAPETTQKKSTLQVSSRIEASLAYDNVLLKTKQQVESTTGTFETLEVKIPNAYQLQSLQVADDLLESISAIEGREGWYRLQLSAPTNGPVTLDWVLSQPIPKLGATIAIEGFEMGDIVQQQSGQIHLAELPGYRLQTQTQDALFRIDVPNSLQTRISRSWEFYRQPFSLILELQKIRPLYSIDPQYVLTVDPEFLVWNADLTLSITRGSLTELSLKWPKWQEANWQLSSDSPDGLIDQIRIDDDDPEILHLVFSEPLHSGKKKLSLIARKPFRLDMGESQIQFPRFPKEAEPIDTEVIVHARQNLDVKINATNDVVVSSVVSSGGENRDDKPVGRFSFPETTARQLGLVVVPREREVIANSTLELKPGASPSTLDVRQSIQYEVSFESLQTLRFRIPESITKSLVVTDDGEFPLELINAAGSDSEQSRIQFSEPQSGSFIVQFQYSVPIEDSSASPVIPLIQPSDASTQQLTLSLGRFLSTRYEPDAEGWRMVTDPNGNILYQRDGDSLLMELLLNDRGDDEAELPLSVRQSLHIAVTDESGLITVRNEYLLTGALSGLQMTIPDDYEIEQVLIDGKPFSDTRNIDGVLSFSNISREQASIPGEYRLRVDLNAPTDQMKLGWIGKLSCQAPELSTLGEESTGRNQDTLWLVELPYRQHLFVQPDLYAPLYRWKRQGVFWVRSPQMTQESLATWIGADPTEMDRLFVSGGNFYLFHKVGPGAEISLHSMHRSVVVLAGAGLTLFICFLLLQLPATRNALTLLVIASTLAIAGVWYPTSVALLLQPAILGFCLACLAAFLDHLFRRPQLPNAVVTFEEPSLGSSQHSQIPHPPISMMEPALGSEDPTEMKHREISEEQVSSFISEGDS